MHRSKFDIGGADAGAGGMSITSGSGGASGMGASSSLSEASAMAHPTGSSVAGSGSMCLEIRSSREWSAVASVTASRKSPTLWARFRHSVAEIAVAVGAQATPTSRPRLDFVAEVLHCAGCPFGRRLAPPCLVHGQAVEGAVKDGAGKRGARLRLDAALEAAEDGHVAVLQVRRASWREECDHDVRESGPHGGPCLSLLAWVQHVVECGRELQDCVRRCPAVL